GSRARMAQRALVVGWPSFVDGIATAGDVLGMEAAREELQRAGLPCDMAFSPVFRPEGLRLEDAEPARYTHLVFACGPLHGPQVAGLHTRYAHCRRVAVGVSVIDPADPAASGFHVILARDGNGAAPQADLALHPRHPSVPVAGVILADTQPEYGERGRGDQAEADLTRWLRGWDCALIPLDTRLDREDWRLPYHPAELEAIIGRLDLVVTTLPHRQTHPCAVCGGRPACDRPASVRPGAGDQPQSTRPARVRRQDRRGVRWALAAAEQPVAAVGGYRFRRLRTGQNACPRRL